MSINRGLGWAVLVVAAVVTGALAAKPVVKLMVARHAIHDGPWATIVTAGSSDAGIYERAAVAVAGLYALSQQETVYYTAFDDSAGDALDGRCDYTMTGRPLPARWWSLTLYGDDNYLIANAASVYSRHAGNLQPGPGGAYAIAVSSQPQAGNWLPSPAAGNFSITARLYNPRPAIFDDLSKVDLPKIERGSCR